MISKVISDKDFLHVLEACFKDDFEIIDLYDPNETVKNIDDVVNNIYKKIIDLKRGYVIKGIYENNNIIGYYITYDKLLLSFSLEKSKRTKDRLIKFFRMIEIDLNYYFYCRLWNKNQRAIKWLEKNGMSIIGIDKEITYLIYNKK